MDADNDLNPVNLNTIYLQTREIPALRSVTDLTYRPTMQFAKGSKDRDFELIAVFSQGLS